MKFECPICHASLRHERIDDGVTVHVISSNGDVETLFEKSNGGDSVYCSANRSHEIPDDLERKVMELVLNA